MKKPSVLSIASILVAGSLLMTSCMQRDQYQPDPMNNNHYTNTTTSFDEEFNGSDIYNWSFTDPTDSAYAGISNGYYQFVDYSKTYYPESFVTTGINTQNNFTVKSSIKSSNMMALIFGASSTDNGYALYIDSMGYYSLYKEGIGSIASTVILPSTQDTLYASKKGWNTIELDQVNGTWSGFINGTEIFQMSARTISGSGFGFKVVPGTTGYADYITVQNN